MTSLTDQPLIQDARRYLAVLHKRRGLLLTAVGLSLLVAVLHNYTTRPVYQATVQLLIEHGADLNITAKYGLSAVMLAVVAGHEEIALALARAGADLTLRGTGAPGFADKTAADLATARGWSHLATALSPLHQRST